LLVVGASGIVCSMGQGPGQTRWQQSALRLPRRSCSVLLSVLALIAGWLMGCTPSPGPSQPAASASLPALAPSIDDQIQHGSVGLRNIRAVLVSQRGDLVAEQYYDSNSGEHLDIGSATKSVISTLVGIAVKDGVLRGTDQTLGELLPQHKDVMAASSARVTVRELLTMTAGWTGDIPDPRRPHLVRRILKSGPQDQPGQFEFTEIGPHLLSAVLVDATGMPTMQYARQKLFQPLGIVSTPAVEPQLADADEPSVVAQDSFRWSRDPDGVHAAAGLAVTASDMMKIGQLWLDGGMWNGEQILDAGYVQEASGNRVPEFQTSLRGYGYLWWVTPLSTHQAYTAFGRYGQLITIIPDVEAVIVVSSRISETALGLEDYIGFVDATIASQLH